MNSKLVKLYNWRVVLVTIAIFTAFYLLILYPWMMRWGATDAELSMTLPGDGIVPVTDSQSTRAVTIHAPADEVWKWVLQIGQERAGFYSNDWLENLTFADIHNTNAIRPEWLPQGSLRQVRERLSRMPDLQARAPASAIK